MLWAGSSEPVLFTPPYAMPPLEFYQYFWDALKIGRKIFVGSGQKNGWAVKCHDIIGDFARQRVPRGGGRGPDCGCWSASPDVKAGDAVGYFPFGLGLGGAGGRVWRGRGRSYSGPGSGARRANSGGASDYGCANGFRLGLRAGGNRTFPSYFRGRGGCPWWLDEIR